MFGPASRSTGSLHFLLLFFFGVVFSATLRVMSTAGGVGASSCVEGWHTDAKEGIEGDLDAEEREALKSW